MTVELAKVFVDFAKVDGQGCVTAKKDNFWTEGPVDIGKLFLGVDNLYRCTVEVISLDETGNYTLALHLDTWREKILPTWPKPQLQDKKV